MKGLKNIKKLFTLFIMFVLALFVTGCETPSENPGGGQGEQPPVEYLDPATFDEYADDVLRYFLDGDVTTINSFFVHPEDFGIEVGEAKMPVAGYESEEEYEQEEAEFLELINKYQKYDYSKLNFDQQMSYETIKYLANYFTTEIEDINYFESSYFGSYMGANVDFPVTLSSYNFRTKQDIENYLSYIDSAPEAFASYIDYEYERTEAGYGFMNSVLHEIVEHAENMVENSDCSNGDHFLVACFNNTIDGLDYLTEEEKETYKALNKEKIAGPFAECYQMIIERMPGLLNKATNEQGLCYYRNEEGVGIGNQYYELTLQYVTGYDYTLEEFLQYIDKKVSVNFADLQNVYSALGSKLNSLMDFEFPEMTVEEQVAYFEQAIVDKYPALSTPYVVDIQYVDEAVEEHYSPAFYILSPVDGNEVENVFLNRKHIYKDYEDPETGEVTKKLDSTYLFTTLAHEGIPGHMYQRLYMKEQDMSTIRLILRCLGTTESWSTYSENMAYELYFSDHPEYGEYADDFFILNFSFSQAIYARMEMGIHYEGWTLDRLYNFMSRYYSITKNDAREVYRQLTELPGNAFAYAFAYLKILDIRDYALEHGASLYDFHKLYLDHGNVPQQVIEENFKEQYK